MTDREKPYRCQAGYWSFTIPFPDYPFTLHSLNDTSENYPHDFILHLVQSPRLYLIQLQHSGRYGEGKYMENCSSFSSPSNATFNAGSRMGRKCRYLQIKLRTRLFTLHNRTMRTVDQLNDSRRKMKQHTVLDKSNIAGPSEIGILQSSSWCSVYKH